MSLDDTIAVLRRNDPLFAPGDQVSYCDSNYALLGAIAERLDGAPLHELVQRRILDPLGLDRTSYPTSTTLPAPHPTPYVPEVLVDGRLLTAETQRARLKTSKFAGQTLDFGYGLGITNFNEYLGHDGAIFGFSSVVLTRPKTGTQIAIVGNESTNSTTPTLSIAVAIIDAIDPSQGTGS
ncbi:serine hydrolase domain-containing protein [Agromyces protaetiae]|uniref:serine hydrolase domain-containing protein n=1 Tax=Agromyces protaetiae TaxID=2509455 RepID=UPI0013E9B811|nr:serine hydrolase domain-containing protein [Agromyces protaetiae]